MIKSLSIKNFRGLDGLKVEDFGRVNLITGANNVGKTALLEAVLLASVAPDPTAILGIVFRREEPSLASNWGLFVSALPRIFSNAQIEKPIEIEFKVKNEAFKLQIEQLSDFKDVLPVLIGALGQANVNDQAVNTYKVLSFTKRQKQKSNTVPLIISPTGPITPIRAVSNVITTVFFAARTRYSVLEEAERFGKVEAAFRKDSLIRTLQILEPNLTEITVRLENGITQIFGYNGIWLPLSHFGDGLSRLTSILLGIYDVKDGYVFIDEIENGLHHSVLKPVWSAINELSKELNVQIFATTHSEECIEAALDVFDNEEIQKDFRLHRLQKVDGKVTASTYESEVLEAAIDIGIEVRGETAQVVS